MMEVSDLTIHRDRPCLTPYAAGHFIPSKANWKNFFVAYMTSFTENGLQGDVPPPGSHPGGGVSATNSAHTTRPGTPDDAGEGEGKSSL
jgi:hypothetical protein